ncbi:CPBP family intramembrane glutamic endopeptidase [Hahella ganghwensis]|uniref:CPBP family intramembrane glutamic endopeptidase n=1 Tax=Hahella ganghwensis TaxID=286420 RepID=UPI00037954D6|nr:CPBP family intramembrane glutamic endopeptidase [Hahella ganghwensis]
MNYKVSSSLGLMALSGILVLIGAIPLSNSVLVCGFGLLIICYYLAWQEKPLIKHLAWIFTILLGFFTATYRPSDFSYPLVWDFTGSGIEFQLHINTAKTICGYLILIWFLQSASKFRLSLHSAFTLSVCSAVLVILSLAAINGVAFLPKLPGGIILFAIVNLFTTVVAEEAFFRLLIQKKVSELFQREMTGTVVSILVASTIFAFAHVPKPSLAFLTFFIAGAVYATVYRVTNRFSMALVCHFTVNIIHFSLFEYPLVIR